MLRLRHARLGAAAVVSALLLCALAATPAFADDSVPPPEPTPVTVEEAPRVSEAAPEAEAPPAEQLQIDPAPAGEVPPAEEPVPPDEPAAPPAPEPAPAPVDGLLAELPGGTTVAVVGEAGEVLPLASTEAAEVLSAGDPIWCPASVPMPVSGGSGCTANYDSLQALGDALALSQPTVDGVIWIQKSYDSSVNDPAMSAFTLNGSSLTTMAAHALTVQGGWDGLGTSTIDTTDPSVFRVPLQILDWGNDVFLSDLWITAVAGPSAALEVDTAGEIAATRLVTVSNSGSGVSLDNTAGTADVMLSESRLSKNVGGTGLSVQSNGAITLADVEASDNAGVGAYLVNTGGSKNVVLTSGTLEFSRNGLNGLTVESAGTISLNNVSADGNGSEGARLDNTAAAAAGVSLSGTNTFSENGSSGLVVLSHGSIKANNLVAVGDNGFGAWLENSGAGSAQPVTLTGSNLFKWNNFGLVVSSRGAITLANVTASFNQTGDGAALSNNYAGSTGNITLTGINAFNENYGEGLKIYSHGSIVLSNLTADENGSGAGGRGAVLDNSGAATPKPVTLSGTNQFCWNEWGGLVVLSKGAVTLSKVTADSNQGGPGLVVQNIAGGTGSPQNVTLTGAQSFDNNYSDGLDIQSYGAITLANVSAIQNGWGDGEGGAILSQAGAVTPKPITLTGTNTFDVNTGKGLVITGKGAITINNLHASFNGDVGAELDNSSAGSVGAVAVKGTSLFEVNDGHGLEIRSRGNITVQNFDANDNNGMGVMLDNAEPLVLANIAVGTSLAGWCNGLLANQSSGIEVFSNGTIALSNLCASENGDSGYGFGIYADNSTATTPKAVTMKGLNSSQDDHTGGIYMFSKGPITAAGLSGVGAEIGYGVYLNNTASGIAAPQPVTLTGHTDISGNYDTGLGVFSYGAISASNVYAESNGAGTGSGNGAYLDNYLGAATLPKNVTLSGTNEFFTNAVTGLLVNSLGTIQASNLKAGYNGVDGARLFNDYPSGVGGITLTGTITLSNNGTNGLAAGSYGPITVSNLRMDENGGNGAYLNNSLATTSKAVTLSGTLNSFTDNGWTGLWVESKGALTVSNLVSQSNDFWGVVLKNNFSGSGSPQKVTVKGYAVVTDNGSTGLEVRSYGAIAINSASAIGNGASGPGTHGVDLDNWLGDANLPQTVTLSGANLFRNNTATGLLVESLGTISVSNVFSDGNGADGVRLSNDHSSSVGGIVLTGTNSACNNGPNGISGDSFGPITASNLTTTGNAGNGTLLRNSSSALAKPLTISGTLNTFSDNGWTGLWVESKSVITVSNVVGESNDYWGVVLKNTFSGSGSPQNVTVNGFATVNDNGRSGLEVRSYGAIVVNNVGALGNGLTGTPGHGMDLDNSTGAVSPMPITVNGANILTGNFEGGLSAQSLGAIKVNNLTANYNHIFGALLYNQFVGASGGVTLTGTSLFEGNLEDGLVVYSRGGIALNNITAQANGWDGAYLDTHGIVAPQNVTLSGTNTFLDNGDFVGHIGAGLEVRADGQVSINNLVASGNADRGAMLDNYTYWSLYGLGGTPGVTLSGASSFVGNYDDGLFFDSVGLVSLTKITADGNGDDGVYGETHLGNVLMACGSLTGNGGSGWYLKFWVPGTATLKGVFSYFNGDFDIADGGMVQFYRSCP